MGENQGDNYTYILTFTGVSSFEDKGNSISFNPSGSENTQISISVMASNSAQPKLTAESSMTMSVAALPSQVEPEAQNSDSGGGGINLFLLFGLILISTIRCLL